MPDETESTTPDETTETPETTEKAKDADAVLAKNKELLGKLAAEKKEREAMKARLDAIDKEKAKADEEALKKAGEFEKLFEQRKGEFDMQLAEKDAQIASMFATMAAKDLRLSLPATVIDELREPFAIVLQAKHIKPVVEDGTVVWKSLDGLETIDLETYLPSLEKSYGHFFKADNNPGGDAPGNNGNVTGGQKRSAMSRAEKTAYIGKHGDEAYLKLPL